MGGGTGGCVIRGTTGGRGRGRGCSVVRCSPPGCRLFNWWTRKKIINNNKTFLNTTTTTTTSDDDDDDDDDDDHNNNNNNNNNNTISFNANNASPSHLLNNSTTSSNHNHHHHHHHHDHNGRTTSSNQQTPLNAELGCCMLYLLAASRNELDKMMELRTQMELLLRSARNDLVTRDQDTLPNLQSHSKDIVALSSAMDCSGSSTFPSPYMLAASESSTTSISMPSVDNFKITAPKPEHSSQGMDHLQAEFEAEFERMQINHDTSFKHLDQNIKAKVMDTDSSQSCNASFREIIDTEEVEPYSEEQYDEEQFDGVSPYELESRLHELLEARQSEQIEELEDALKCISRKLQEKEMEISWWKDTAHLVMENIPEPLRRDLNTKHIMQ